MILTESILDALSLMAIGFQNLDALYGTNGLSETHIQALKEAGTREVILALDNDDAGRRGAIKIAERLRKEAIVSRSIFPPCKDWNEYLVSKGSVEEKKAHIEGLIQEASLMSVTSSTLTFSYRNGRCHVKSDELSYQIVKTNDSSSFRVNIRVSLNTPSDGNLIKVERAPTLNPSSLGKEGAASLTMWIFSPPEAAPYSQAGSSGGSPKHWSRPR